MSTNPSPLATILAVDDSSEFLEMLVEILTPAGYQVRTADSGESALAAVAAVLPDLILLDIRMHGMDGLEVCRRLKAREETRHIPIILISGFAKVKELAEGLQLGAADYINKPFLPEELLARVKAQLALSRAVASLKQRAADLHQSNEQLHAEIGKRQRVEDELRQSLDRAERSRRAMLSALEDQKRTETAKEKLQTQLNQAQKLQSIGTLAGGIAHDFNNILTAILGYAELVKNEIGEQSPAVKDLQQVITAAKRAVDLVRQILTFSRQSEQQRQPIQIQYIVKEALKFLRPSISTSIHIKSVIDPECPAIFADPTEIHQVIMNLCTNAYHAMCDMKRNNHVLELQLAPIALNEAAVLDLGLHLSPGRFVKMSVSDTGCGMDAKTRARIFDPYFTTKKKGQGTGLGLATVHSIVTRAGGAIIVESEIGKGATFRVFLPVYEGYAPEKVLVKGKKIVERGTERIMVIDDEEALVKLLQRTLEKLGYQVSAFTNSEEGLRVFTAQPMAFDLVITDLNMPKVTGTALARAFLETRPDLPIILCTGFSEKIDTEMAIAIGIKKFLYKPVDRNDLARLVRKILDEHEVKHDT